ncbi:MAG: dTDP-4-dehydrorhamnose 3,5-epimerase family protein [Nitriliruptoraceae bacterium]
MAVEETAIEGLYVVRQPTREDGRGFFRETYRHSELTEAIGRSPSFVQANHSRSRAGVLRGFHAEPWDKLVYVARGTAFCAVADIRATSPTCGEVATFLLGDAPGERIRLFVALGLANAFCAVTDVDYLYDVSAEWHAGVEKRSVAWDDEDLAVPWPVADPVVSPDDRDNPTLAELLRG